MTHKELDRHLANYLRVHRRNVGLTQAELGDAVGYSDAGTIGRHELFRAMPPLAVAIGYEIVFRVPVAELFAGLRDETKERIETRLSQLESELGQRSAREPNAAATARKLVWLAERKNPEYRSQI